MATKCVVDTGFISSGFSCIHYERSNTYIYILWYPDIIFSLRLLHINDMEDRYFFMDLVFVSFTKGSHAMKRKKKK